MRIDERIAHHESGHVVLALATGLGIRFATMEPPEVLTDSRRSTPIACDIERRVMFHVAGYAAERIYAPDSTKWANSQYDFDRANELLAGRDAVLLMREAKKVIALHWRQVEAVARALLERKRLSGSEIERMVHRSVASCPPFAGRAPVCLTVRR